MEARSESFSIIHAACIFNVIDTDFEFVIYTECCVD